ncbi:hypothetical protein [Nostoc sp.]|uniref:hypothetical protein n=1 Tax=Nostoc sp. TaxID=1180 RepID=UPI002FF9B037
MSIDTIALSVDTITLSVDTIALSVDTITLSVDTIALSVDTIALSADTIICWCYRSFTATVRVEHRFSNSKTNPPTFVRFGKPNSPLQNGATVYTQV